MAVLSLSLSAKEEQVDRALRAALSEKHPEVRQKTVSRLRGVSTPAAIRVLSRFAAEGVENAMFSMGQSDSAEVMEAFLELARNPSEGVRLQAVPWLRRWFWNEATRARVTEALGKRLKTEPS